MDARLAKRLREKKAVLDQYRPLPVSTLSRLNEDLKVLSTYHSNAIEGNTLNLHETQMVVDYGMTLGSHSLREYQEAANHAHAYDYVVSLVSEEQKNAPITQDILLTLHRFVVKSILDEAQVGQWRVVPVYIRGSNMTPPPARDVPRLMREWMEWINGPRGEQYEPITRAAIAHHGFEAVHPYVDGNGRVGRLLLNLMLMREGYPPALVLKDWRIRYIHGLNEANTGQYGPLVNLIGQAVEACLDLYLEACATSATSEEEDYLPLADLAREFGYNPEYLSWLARYSRLEAVKRGRRWYARRGAVEKYRVEVEQHISEQRDVTHQES
jgi:Fic family protein